MSRVQRTTCFVFVTWTVAVLLAGCAGMRLPKAPVSDVAPERRARSSTAAADFEARRSFAEFQVALSFWERDDVQGCQQTLDRLIRRNPDYLEARLLAAEVCLQEGDHEEALAHLDAAEKAHAEDPRVHHSRGLVLDAMNQPSAALADYKQAVDLAPDEELFAASYHAAVQAASDPSGSPAAPPLSAATGLALATDEPRPTADLSSGSADRAGFSDDGSADTVAALLRRAATALEQEKPEAALACYTAATRQEPENPQIGITAAVQSLRANYPDLSVEVLGPLAVRFPTSARLRQVLGIAYYRTGDYRSSQVALQQALSLDKSSALTYFLMGCTLAKLGQQDSAAAHLRQARTLDPRFAASS